jgi:hypothetical protein
VNEYDRKRSSRRSLLGNLLGATLGMIGCYYGMDAYYDGDEKVGRIPPVLFAFLSLLLVFTCSNSLFKLNKTSNKEAGSDTET